MPRRKNKRKARRGRHHPKQTSTQNLKNTENELRDSPEVLRTCFDNSVLSNKSIVMSPSSIEQAHLGSNKTPSPILAPQSLIYTTPLARKYNYTRNSNTWNVTNLNVLFNSPISNSSSEIRLNTSNDFMHSKRSLSSIPKLHSPGKEKPLLVHTSTQTNENVEKYHVETPRISQVILVSENTNWEDEKNVQVVCNKVSRFNKNEVNFNPYLKSIEIQNTVQDNSYREMSFFSPQLEFKSSSTPIEKLLQNFKGKTIGDNIENYNTSVLTNSHKIKDKIKKPLLSKIKRYSRISAKWSARVLEACTHLGLQIKNSLTSICTNIYAENLLSSEAELSELDSKCHKCEEYKQEIYNLTFKIRELDREMVNVKQRIEENKNCEKTHDNNIQILQEELNKVKEELLTQKTELRSELTSLKEQLTCFKTAPPILSIVPPPPPLPCLPPPPPPPPPPLPMITSTPKLQIGKKSKKTEDSCDKSRPIISLDDILKVKLKKAAERTPYMAPYRRTTSQPVVSMDMLRQVKLRPATKVTSLRPDTPNTDSSSNTSPCSSLCRMLNNDAVWRLKRLRRNSAYSFDSIYRKNLLSPRSRDRSDTS